MNERTDLGNAFLDIVLVGVVVSTIALIVDAVIGGGVEWAALGLTALLYGAYVIGALRLEVSPVRYLTDVTRRSNGSR